MLGTCVPLTTSSTCPSFSSASVSTNKFLRGLFPFLANVTDTRSFDVQLTRYIGTSYTQSKYQTLFGCSNLDLKNASDLYARYTTSFLCNAIVQNSVRPCQTRPADAPPLCVDTCAEFALSEQRIVFSPQLCGVPGSNAVPQLRADFTDCGLPGNSISGTCVEGYKNEPDNCGFSSNILGLCSFCRSSTVNSTDSCCVSSNAESRCRNVALPVFSSMRPVFSTTTVSVGTSTATAAPGSNGAANNGLSGGQIAGIVVGSVVGGLLILGLLICCCIMIRRRKQQNQINTLNQPTPPRSGVGMAQSTQPPPFEALPGARVTRMTALEAFPGSSPDHGQSGDSSGFNTSPESQGAGPSGVAGVVPERKKNEGLDGSSPESAEYSSPENGAGQSERMSSFKDYYSSDEIHTGDLVSTLWAYQPRAPDEFELERGDMLKVVGIWDDGWATGVRVSTRAGDWSPSQRSGRDSVVSSDSARAESSGDSDIKAFPHWRATIEGEPSSPPPSD